MTISSAISAPIEMFGAQSGISVIDPSTILKRLWYFDGKFLRAEGFRLDQEYVRSLVALSNQAVGSGLVHGFDVSLDGGDSLQVTAGLGLAPSGRAVFHPSPASLAISTLIARATGGFDPGVVAPAGTADFGRCRPDDPAGPDQVVSARDLYVLTVAPADALCGEEERFGRLCEDACASETDRSVALEGVRFRVHPLSLTLPTSRLVPFTATHLRSRVASAYYARERTAIASMISGAGLRDAVWCHGAEGIGGDEIGLAVFDRAGQVTTFVDMWTARRELIEQTPHRYWQWRLAMRPLDVFLAQVLQFQCQLVSSAGGSDPTDGDPGCVEERRALAAVDEVLGVLAERPGAGGVAPVELLSERATVEELHAIGHDPAAPFGGVPKALIDRLSELRTVVAGALSGVRRPGSGSLLIDAGIVETPSAGYLPVDPSRDVQRQVEAWMGPGVDLRFCAVRPDFVPEAFFEAQHMERISLTHGIDVPAEREEVDVLVPGGRFDRREIDADAFTGEVRILPSRRKDGEGGSVEGAALALSAVARNQLTDGWSWSLAAFGEAPRQLSVVEMVRVLFSTVANTGHTAEAHEAPAPAAVEEEPALIHVESIDDHRAVLSDAGLLLRAVREGSQARVRFARVVDAANAGVAAVVDDFGLAPSQRRPVSLWLDVSTVDALDEVALHTPTRFDLQATVYSRASTTPVLVDVQLRGRATVTSRQSLPSPTGGSIVTLTTQLDAAADALIIADGNVNDPDATSVAGAELRWRIAVDDRSKRIVSIETGDGSRVLYRATFADEGDPRKVAGLIDLVRAGLHRLVGGNWDGVATTPDGTASVRLAETRLTEGTDVLAPGQPGRDLANSVIDVIGAALAAYQRTSSFVEHARERMFGGASATTSIEAAADWVMFHRRRTKVCGDAVGRPSTAVRRIRWYHAVRMAGQTASEFEDLSSWREFGAAEAKSAARTWSPLSGLGFEPVATLEFEEGSIDLHSAVGTLRTAWSSAPRGSRLTSAVMATVGVGDGAAVERGRLQTATASIADLIDVANARLRNLDEIPPEFQSEGTHGVILTVGVERVVETRCAHLFRLDKERFARLTEILANFSTIDELTTAARDMGALDPLIATFEDDRLANPDEVAAWWDGGAPGDSALVLDRAVDRTGSDAERWHGPRTDQLRDVIGFAGPDPREAPDLTTAPCDAVFLIERR